MTDDTAGVDAAEAEAPPRSQEPADIARRLEAILMIIDEPQSLVSLAAATNSSAG